MFVVIAVGIGIMISAFIIATSGLLTLGDKIKAAALLAVSFSFTLFAFTWANFNPDPGSALLVTALGVYTTISLIFAVSLRRETRNERIASLQAIFDYLQNWKGVMEAMKVFAEQMEQQDFETEIYADAVSNTAMFEGRILEQLNELGVHIDEYDEEFVADMLKQWSDESK